MCSVRHSRICRPLAWLLLSLVVTLFALPGAAVGKIYHATAGDGSEGDPIDGHDAPRGAGGGSLIDFGEESSVVAPSPAPESKVPAFFVPVFVFSGAAAVVTLVWFDIDSISKISWGGIK